MYKLIITTTFLFSLSSLVYSASQLQAVLDQAKQKGLANSQTWLNMLHYNDDNHSYIDDDAFFLSDRGKTDPSAELNASIEQLLTRPELLCQFPWRARWLSNNLDGYAALLKPQKCADYDAWRAKLSDNSVTLVFASSYLNSPSSMYGHTFLRFDNENQESGMDLTAYAVNFGAVVNDGGGFLYAFNGIFGGYPGYFSDGPYYSKVKEYSRLDNRDIWEYKLNLTPHETDIVLTHLWELNNIKFDYFFFDENCSFRLLELIQVARPEVSLLDDFDNFAMPLDTVKAVENAGLIDEEVYRPSNQSRLESSLAQLSETEKHLVKSIIKKPQLVKEDEFLSLDEPARFRVAQAAYQASRYQNNRKVRTQSIANNSFILLQTMRQYSDFSEPVEIKRPAGALTGHGTKALTFSAGYENLDNTGFIDLEFRGSYHDLLDNARAYPEATSLNMGRIKLRYYDDNTLQLQSLGLAEVSSLSPRVDFFKPISWRIRVGLDREWTHGDEELNFNLNGGGGWTLPLFGDLNGFALIQGRLEYNPGFDRKLDVAAGASTGLLLQHQSGSFFLEGEYYKFTDNVERRKLYAGYQLPLSKNQGLRFELSRKLNDEDRFTEGSVSYRLYF